MSKQTLDFYKTNNKKLIEQYNSVSFESIHQDWLELLPSKGSLIIDVGAGSGRDVFWLSKRGYQVVAVDPVVEFFEQFKTTRMEAYHKGNIDWIVDSLPELESLYKYNGQVSLILLSAVWMHLTTEERIKSFQSFSHLNKKGGLLVITLRYGQSPDERLMYPVSIREIKDIANNNQYKIKSVRRTDDQLNRSDVFWETIVLKKSV